MSIGQIFNYQNGVRDGQYLLDDEYTEWPAQLTAVRIEELIEEYQSTYQHIAIYQSTYHGRLLVLDGYIQVTVADNFCYHEMIVHVPMAVIPQEPTAALVIGGGDGAAVNQLCLYPSLQKIVWVDIDADVVRLCKKHIPELQSNHDERVEFIAMNGADIDYHQAFDLIVIDGTDPIGGGESLWSEKFYNALNRALKPHGVITALGFWAWPDPHVHRHTKKLAQAHFAHTHYYWFLDPTMKYGHMGVFLMTNEALDPATPTHLERVPLANASYYNAAIHSAAFALPTCFTADDGFVPANQ